MFRIAAILLLAALPVQPATVVQQGKPVRDEPINTYFKAPPATLSAMIAEAELVLFGRFVGGTPKDSDDPDKGRSTLTGHRLKVAEVLRVSSSRKVGNEIEVVRRGGDRDRGSYIERSYQIGFPPFQNGHEYVLFLVWNTALDAWVPAYGPDSAIDVTGGAAHSAGQSDLIRSLEGKSTAELLDLVRRGGQ